LLLSIWDIIDFKHRTLAKDAAGHKSMSNTNIYTEMSKIKNRI